MIESIFANSEFEVVILNADGGHDDQMVVIDNEIYFQEKYYSEVGA